MLGKLIKYDFKELFKSLTPIFLITILLSVFAKVANYLSDKIAILEYPAALINIFCYIMIFGIPFVAFIVGMIKYYNSMVKDEGYLTHTLPVKKSNLVLSKLITTSVVNLLACTVSIISIFIVLDTSSFMPLINDLISQIIDYDRWIMPLVIVSVIISYISNVLLVYASIALGQKHNGSKIGYAIVYGIVIYNVSQIVSSLMLFLPAIFNKNYMSYFDAEVPPALFLDKFIIFAIIISIAITLVYYYLTTLTLEKKLNLD